MKTRKILSLISALVFALAAPASLAEGLALTDMAGREITLDAPAARVIALNPADCEILLRSWRGRCAGGPRRILQLSRSRAGTAQRQQRRGDQY